MIADSHCHCLDPKLVDTAEEIICRLKDDGLDFVVEISADPDEAKAALGFAEGHKNVYCTIGVHPMMAELYNDDFEKWALAQKGNNKIVAVGEIGLDYFHMTCSEEVQKDIFIRQLKLADKMGLPVVVHTRDAFEDTFGVLCENKQYISNGLLIHCFSSGAEEVERLKIFDAYIAFGGAVTYKNNKTAPDTIRAVPLNRILVETDCPYLAPVPLRGTINEPKNVKYVAEHIAKVLNLTTEEVEMITLENTKRFYRIK